MLAHRYRNGCTTAITILGDYITRQSFLCNIESLCQLFQGKTTRLMAYKVINVIHLVTRLGKQLFHHDWCHINDNIEHQVALHHKMLLPAPVAKLILFFLGCLRRNSHSRASSWDINCKGILTIILKGTPYSVIVICIFNQTNSNCITINRSACSVSCWNSSS